MLPKARILIWDIETTNLRSDFGFILAIGYKWLGEKRTHVLTIGDFHARNFRQKEKALVRKFAEILDSADISVTHNGQRYDHPWINAKMREHRLCKNRRPWYIKSMPQVDTLQIARKHLKTVSRKRLDTLSAYLGTYAEKTPVDGRIWVDAAMGVKSALKYIVDHCRADVEVLEEVYLILRPLFQGHPRVNGFGPCRMCGSYDLIRRGFAYSSTRGPQIHLVCQECGGGERRPYGDCLIFPEEISGGTHRPRRKAA